MFYRLELAAKARAALKQQASLVRGSPAAAAAEDMLSQPITERANITEGSSVRGNSQSHSLSHHSLSHVETSQTAAMEMTSHANGIAMQRSETRSLHQSGTMASGSQAGTSVSEGCSQSDELRMVPTRARSGRVLLAYFYIANF